MNSKVFYSYRTSHDRGQNDVFAWGKPHYSYQVVKNRFLAALNSIGVEAIELIAPEIYKTEQALRLLREQHDVTGEFIHLIFKPAEELRLLEGARNILVFYWEYSHLVDTPAGGLCLGNQARTIAGVDEFWVSSTHIGDVLIKAGIARERIKFIPCPIPTPQSTPAEQPQESIEKFLSRLRLANLGLCLVNSARPQTSTTSMLISRGGVSHKLFRALALGQKVIDVVIKRERPIKRDLGSRFFNLALAILKRGLSFLRLFVPFVARIEPRKIHIESVEFPHEINLNDGLRESVVRVKLKNKNARAISVCHLTNISAELLIETPVKRTIQLLTETNLIIGPGKSAEIAFSFSNAALDLKGGKYSGKILASYCGTECTVSKNIQFEISHRPYVPDGAKSKIFCAILNPFDERKNLIDLILAFSYFSRTQPNAILILKFIVDQKTFSFEYIINSIRKLVDPYRCNDLIHRTYVTWDVLSDNDLAKLLQVSDFYVAPSLGEGLGLPILEGMSHGAIPIAPRHSALADYIDETSAIVLPSTPMIWRNESNPQATDMRLINQILFWDIVKALEHASALNQNQMVQLSENAKKSAARYFANNVGQSIANRVVSTQETLR